MRSPSSRGLSEACLVIPLGAKFVFSWLAPAHSRPFRDERVCMRVSSIIRFLFQAVPRHATAGTEWRAKQQTYDNGLALSLDHARLAAMVAIGESHSKHCRTGKLC